MPDTPCLLETVLPTALVVHDAGAANHIVAWLQAGYLGDISLLRFCFKGPAEKILCKLNADYKNEELADILDHVSVVLSGTGWSSDLEHEVRVWANKEGVRSIAVIDHWVNYQERFTRHGYTCLPAEIWVTDDYALAKASDLFSKTKVVLQPNTFMDIQCQEVAAFKNDSVEGVSQGANVLFVMEPVREAWVKSDVPGEVQAFNFFIENYHYLDRLADESMNIVIKPHPSDPNGKYEPWLRSYGEHRVSVDEQSTLAALIAWSDIVVGCQTYAMVVAMAAGREVVSALPPNATECLLPHKEILQLRALVK